MQISMENAQTTQQIVENFRLLAKKDNFGEIRDLARKSGLRFHWDWQQGSYFVYDQENRIIWSCHVGSD